MFGCFPFDKTHHLLLIIKIHQRIEVHIQLIFFILGTVKKKQKQKTATWPTG